MTSTANKAAPKATPSPYFTDSFKVIPFSYLYKAGAAVAVFMLVLIPALAERTVPGDGLYAIKVQFNEEVRSTLSFTSYQKIEWETTRLNRRIAEARQLANEGRLTEEVGSEVAVAVKLHTENAKREIELLRNNDEEAATLATIELNTTLEVQAASFAEGENETGEDSVSDSDVSTKVLASAIGEVSAKESAVNPGLPSYDKLVARVEENTTRVHELLETLKLDHSSLEYVDVNRRIADIDNTVQEAIVQFDMNDESARMMLVDALQRTQKLIVFMTEIRANKEFEVEDFVPVVLTNEEKQTKIFEYREESQANVVSVEEKMLGVLNPDVVLKATATIASLHTLEAKIATSTDYVEVKTLHKEIKNLTTDLQKMFELNQTTRATSTDTAETPVLENQNSENEGDGN